ncbi:reverse transcriptase-like protein [Plakobranchus ocellatus]|uniref:Reverse transcriptase-like protein n=1 Tax=Plakobranchus ocellatus TaxID=259542 RepID=A0AAV3ZIX2_9GAST|nr:reverse transcriptase-like protein [Plakobranchus ocellatus]
MLIKKKTRSVINKTLAGISFSVGPTLKCRESAGSGTLIKRQTQFSSQENLGGLPALSLELKCPQPAVSAMFMKRNTRYSSQENLGGLPALSPDSREESQQSSDQGLEVRLQEHGITGRMYGWLKAFLTELFIRTQIKGTLSRTRPLADRLPQGSARSCTLFLIFMNNIATRCRRRLWIFVLGTTPSRGTTSQGTLAYRSPTAVPKASHRRSDQQVRERTGILQKLAGTNWGATPKSLRTIYVSFIRPVLEYANLVLNLASRTSLEKLDRVQNVALRLVWGALRSTPIAILELAA